MPYKLWNSGEVLTSADFNSYIAKQSVITCTSATRPTTGLVEGMTIFQTDTDNYWFYDGVTWMPASGLQPIKPTSVTNATLNGHVATIGTAVSTVTVYGVFSANYSSYRVVIAGYDNSVNGAFMAFKFQPGHTSGWYGAINYTPYNNYLSTVGRNNDASALIGRTYGNSGATYIEFTVSNPFSSSLRKVIVGQSHGNLDTMEFSCLWNDSTSQTGFHLLTTSGTITGGTITVYGYR